MGALDDVTVIELAGIGPGPFCAMVLGDMGGEVIRVERPSATSVGDVTTRNRRSMTVDLKQPDGAEILLRLLETSDVLIEGCRWRSRAARYRTGRLPRVEPATRLRANDRLGPRWSTRHRGWA
jgi:crotonobetainyl-CoA:carnitine CoA-transferase CaiB-like acyl-CoA transferase